MTRVLYRIELRAAAQAARGGARVRARLWSLRAYDTKTKKITDVATIPAPFEVTEISAALGNVYVNVLSSVVLAFGVQALVVRGFRDALAAESGGALAIHAILGKLRRGRSQTSASATRR